MQTGGASFTGLLDDVPGAGIAFGLRRLNSAYTGSLIRIVRASDNAEQDIGYSGEDLDEAAVNSFCSGTTCYIGKCYDQSGNGYDALGNGYPTQTNLPIIYTGGAIVELNGKPAMQITHPRTLKFTISAATLDEFLTPGAGAAKAGTWHMIGQQGSASSTPYKIILQDEETGGDQYLWLIEAGGAERIEFVSFAGALGATFTDDAQLSMIWQVNGNDMLMYENGSNTGSQSVGGTAPAITNTGVIFDIGGLSFSTRNIEGYIQEVALWPTVKTISTIFNNADTYYSIP